ncbi:MAG: prepilin-type N-terminal cleavage/methylation domain-containing protein [Acaryochloridaceae cyanobacterium SU_2_1]|nr:prepilin-type N-terminal cleavage/methylation domain-containing protein [Acaryochloridaceae cyanobacterium SU_2_1]
MKTELKAKLLQHYIKKNGNKGFTLIELLVVVIIIGILAAVALPSMLSQANKAREAGAQSQLGAINRAQQSYRLENTSFATTSAALGMGTTVDTNDFTVAITTGTATAGNATATPKDAGSGMVSYSGCVTQSGGTTTAAIKKAAAC